MVLIFNIVSENVYQSHWRLPPPPPPQHLKYTSMHIIDLTKLFEIVCCFNCDQVLILITKQSKQDVAGNSRNFGTNIAAKRIPSNAIIRLHQIPLKTRCFWFCHKNWHVNNMLTFYYCSHKYQLVEPGKLAESILNLDITDGALLL